MLGESFDGVMRAAQLGEGWACSRLYAELSGPVTSYLRRQGAGEPDDVASETFIHVFERLGSFSGDEGGFRSWVFTIAHRRLIDERRRRSRRLPSVDLSGVPEPVASDRAESGAMAAEADDTVAAHLAVLSEPQRDVVLLRVVAGLTVEETADAVGRSRDAVRQLQHRGLRVLEHRLRECPPSSRDGHGPPPADR